MSRPLKKATFEMSSQSTMKAPGQPYLCVAIATNGHKGGAPTLCAKRFLSGHPCSRHATFRAIGAPPIVQPKPKAASAISQPSAVYINTTIIGDAKIRQGTAKITQNLAPIAEPERERAVNERKVSVRGYVKYSKRGV
jgi:hypothetical protein